jgi:hypothetical protein
MKLLFLVAAAIIAGCGGDVSGPGPLQSHLLALAPNDAQATGVVRGTILGMRLVNPADTTSFEHVAGASIAVYLEFTHLPVDSSEGPKHQLLGTVTSDGVGKFELTNVPDGYYRLDVAPPTGSPYAPATSGTVAFKNNSETTSLVWLQLK